MFGQAKQKRIGGFQPIFLRPRVQCAIAVDEQKKLMRGLLFSTTKMA